jgi:ubiquinone/menaquinone biosynthesis C-methylase UbiE
LPIRVHNQANLVPGGRAFDRIAGEYDDVFTRSCVGRAQRRLVHRELDAAFRPGSRILDINCGTGEDALHMSARGIDVLACDASPAMIDVCREKQARAGCTLPAAFLVCANESLDTLAEIGPFDGALSNFGGLNCTSDLSEVGRILAALVRPGGAVFLCVMSRVCAWEIAWHVLTAQWRKAFRRLPSEPTATIGGLTIRLYYSSVRQIAAAWAPWFRLEHCRGVGLFVPPSWLEPVFRNRPRTLRFLEWLDSHFGAWPVLRNFADHTLLRFEREGQ